MSDPTTDRWCPGHHHPDAHPNGAPVWCLDHTEDITTALRSIPALTATAASRRDGRLLAAPPGTGRPRGGTPTPPSPSPGYDVVEETTAGARAWAAAVAGQVGDTDPEARTLPGAVGVLTRYLTPALVGPDAVRFGTWVLVTARALRRLAGEEPPRHRLPVPCPVCDRLALVREDGVDRVQCLACQHRVSDAGYQELLVEQVAAVTQRSA